jgi:hypothetical protein
VEYGGIAPLILNLVPRWRRVVGFIAWFLYSQGKSLHSLLNWRMGWPKAGWTIWRRRNLFLHHKNWSASFLICPAHSLHTTSVLGTESRRTHKEYSAREQGKCNPLEYTACCPNINCQHLFRTGGLWVLRFCSVSDNIRHLRIFVWLYNVNSLIIYTRHSVFSLRYVLYFHKLQASKSSFSVAKENSPYILTV